MIPLGAEFRRRAIDAAKGASCEPLAHAASAWFTAARLADEYESQCIGELEKEVERLRTDVARWKHSNDNWKREVERLKGRETLAGFPTTTLRKAAAGTPFEFPKRCGCGASVRDVPTHEFPWNCNPGGCLTQPMKDGWHCIVCGEELKA